MTAQSAVDLGANQSAHLFRQRSPGCIVYKAEGLDVLRDFYRENHGKLDPVLGAASEGRYRPGPLTVSGIIEIKQPPFTIGSVNVDRAMSGHDGKSR
jgi:hypothetical protein